jgi:hypothetical protein
MGWLYVASSDEGVGMLLLGQAALLLYYTHAADGRIGEAWDDWSWVQVGGLAAAG